MNLLSVSTLMLFLKALTGFRAGAEARKARFILLPLLAPNSLSRLRPLSSFPSFLRSAGGRLGALLLYYWVYWKLVETFQLRGLALSYLAAPLVMLMLEVVVAILTLMWLPIGSLLPPPHCRPWAARSVAEFWGRRWNLWMSDWFRYAILAPLRRRPMAALWLAFLVSGVAHEYVLNLTLWIITGKKLFGTMMIYFLLQAAGVMFERRFLKTNLRAKVLWAWLIVLGPVPLVFHESMLRTLHLWVD